MIAENYFYKTVVAVASGQGYTVKELATICETTPNTLSKQLKRVDGCGLSSSTCRKLQEELAPNKTIEELFPEVFRSLSEEFASRS